MEPSLTEVINPVVESHHGTGEDFVRQRGNFLPLLGDADLKSLSRGQHIWSQ